MIPALVAQQDPPELDFAHDAAWHELDLSSLLIDSSAAVGVILRAHKDYSGPEVHQFGVDVDSWTIPFWRKILHSRCVGDVVAKLTDGKIWLYATNDNVDVYLMGELWSPGTVIFDSPWNWTPTIGDEVNTWAPRYLAPLEDGLYARDIEAALVQSVNTSGTTGYWSVRRFGSSYAETFRTDADQAFHWAPCKAGRAKVLGVDLAAVELYGSGTAKPLLPAHSHYLVGYIRKGHGFEAAFDPFEVPLETAATWNTIEAPAPISPKVVGVVGRLQNQKPTGYVPANLRTPGTSGFTPDLERGGNHMVGTVAATNADRQFDAYLSTLTDTRLELLAAMVDERIGVPELEIRLEPRVCGRLDVEPRAEAVLELEPRVRGRLER